MREPSFESVGGFFPERVTTAIRVRERGALLVVSALLVLVPFFVVAIPPITDLPQHLAQIRLLDEALANPDGPYRIQWWTPYSLSYAILALTGEIAPAPLAGRLALAIIALLWVAAAHALAASRRRSPLAAVLASLFVFSNVLYWGFLSFAIGWPLFVAWMLLSGREMRRAGDVLGLAAVGLALYASHALWLLAGIAWIGVVTLVDAARAVRRHDPLRSLLRPMLWRACSVAPAVIALAVWTPSFRASHAQAPAIWDTTPLERLDPRWIVDAALGGLRGWPEWLLMGFVAVWLATAAIQHRRRLREAIDGPLLLAAAMLGLFALLLPDKYMHTIHLAQRWMPAAIVLLLLGMPALRLRPVLNKSAVLACAAAFTVATATTWIAFERRELTGLAAAVERLPPNPRVLGLDYRQTSELVRGRPFLQAYAWAQVFKGGRLNFSFASFPTSLVVFRSQRPTPWTPRLYWYPDRLQRADLTHFDYVIVNGTPGAHRAAVTVWRFVPLTTRGSWRLYRVDHTAAAVRKPELSG
jgi:hypothetical protein